MAHEFIVKNGLISPGSAQITGSLTVLGGITGNLTGTASWAQNAKSSSTSDTASYVDGFNIVGVVSESIYSQTAGTADTASFAWNAETASIAISASWAPDQTVSVNSASWASASISASYSDVALSSSWSTDQLVFVGMINVPSIMSSSLTPTGSIISIGTGSVNLCNTPDGLGSVDLYQLPSASFAITSQFLDAQYITADWNGGSPQYNIVTDKSLVDGIQSTLVYTILVGAGGVVSYSSWDAPGILLANKDYLRVQALRGIERQNGYVLGVSGSTAENFITVTSGSAWQGIKVVNLPAVNSLTSRFVLVAHSASVWSGSLISASVYNRYDNGTSLVPLLAGDFVVNWVYRAVGNQNSTLVLLSTNFQNLPDAVASQPPTPPSELKDVAFLTGRIILKNSSPITNRLQQVDSAYVQTFAPAGITDHNNLNNIQGGATGEYYHLTSASYANVIGGHSASWASASLSSSYSPVEPDYSASVASSKQNALVVGGTYQITSSWANHAVSASWVPDLYPQTEQISASWASASLSSSYADKALSASWAPDVTVTVDSASWASASISASWADSSSKAIYAERADTASYAYTSSYELVYEESSSWSSQSFSATSASWASASLSSSFAETASNVLLSGIDGYVPIWKDNQLTATSSIQTFGPNGEYVTINSASYYDPSMTPALHVRQADPISVNAGYFEGDTDNFIQIVMNNNSTGSGASSDLIGQPDDGNVVSHYIDLGINSTQYNDPAFSIQDSGGGYLYVESGSLSIGTSTPGFVTKFHAGGTVTGSEFGRLDEINGFSLTGSITTASYVKSVNLAKTASYLYLSQSYIDSESGSSEPAWKEGRMWWDEVNHTYAIFNDNSNVSLQIGQEQYIHAVAGEVIGDGKAVYIGGAIQDPDNASNHIPIVYKAIADGTGTKAEVVGLTTHAFTSGSAGWVTVNGKVNGLNTSTFTDGAILWLDPSTAGEYTMAKPGQPYETVQIGYCVYSNISAGKILVSVSNFPAPSNAYAGITSNIIVENLLDGTVGVSSGSVNLYANSTGYGSVTGYSLLPTTLSLVTGSTNYIVSERTGSVDAKYTLTTDSTYANGINIVRVATLDIYQETTSSWDVHIFNVGIVGLALANKSNNKDIILHGYERQNGLTLYTTGSTGEFGITEGTVWYGPNSHIVPTFETTLPGYYTYIFHTSGSGWYRNTSSIYLNGVYDNGAGSSSLTTCAPDSWSVNFVFRLIGTTDESAIVMSDAQYPTELDAAKNAVPPPNLPSTIRDIGMLVGRFIVKSGSYASVVVESAFTTIFASSIVTNHEDLLGLQGGQGGEHRHLTADEYIGTGQGVFMRQNNPTASNIMHAPATPYHVPYWSAGKTLTYTGSVQVQQGKYVTINSASLDPINPEALLVYQTNTSSANTIGAYSNVDNFSQVYNQNFSSGSEASTDICVTADIGTQDTNFLDMGIGSSGYASAFWPWVKPLDGYIDIHGGDLWLALLTDNKLLFVFNNTASTNYADKTGFYLSGSLHGTSSWANTSSYAKEATFTTTSVSASYSYQNDFSVSSSWASQSVWSENSLTASYVYGAVSASWASSSVSSSYVDKALTASWVPNIYPQTEQISASWASASFRAVSSSYAEQAWSASWAPAVPTVSASWADRSGNADSASNAISASWAPNLYPQTYQESGSWASASISASYAGQALSASWAPMPTISNSSSWASSSISASYAGQALSASWSPDQGATTLVTASTYEITASWAISASWAPDQTVTVDSASWASASISSSYSDKALSASWSPNQGATTLVTASTYQITASWANNAVSASWAPDQTVTVNSASWASASISASYADVALSASWSPNQGATTLVTASTYQITSSWAINALTSVASTSASWASSSISASRATTSSYAITASFVLGMPAIKSGIISGSVFAGAPRIATVTFTKPFPDNNYSVTVTGESSRTYTIQSKVSGSFVINANNNTAFTNFVYWQAITGGEFYS